VQSLLGAGLLQVDLSSNAFEGGLPHGLVNLEALMYLNVSFNQLNSLGDASTWKLPALITLDVSSNVIEGERWCLCLTALLL
jgi:Leucine-rich repeat (LRR) protein